MSRVESVKLKVESESAIVRKSFEFAVKIIYTVRELKKKSGEYELLSQLLRSGTSIGANVNEAQQAQSKKDFVAKMSIALKEASETKYWLCLLREVEILPKEKAESLLEQANELVRILKKIIKSTKEALTNEQAKQVSTVNYQLRVQTRSVGMSREALN
jgi:TIGR02436 family protein